MHHQSSIQSFLSGWCSTPPSCSFARHLVGEMVIRITKHGPVMSWNNHLSLVCHDISAPWTYESVKNTRLHCWFDTHLKFNSSPLKSYHLKRKGGSSSNHPGFQGRTGELLNIVKLRSCIQYGNRPCILTHSLVE